MISEWLFFTLLAGLLGANSAINAWFAAPQQGGVKVMPWREALPGYRYQFPRDHFEHPDFRTEWWYYTGNVHTADGARFGFELVFFRQGERRGPSDNRSAWRIDDMYLAHVALTDVGSHRFLYKERLNRAGPGIAGASFAERRVWNGNWSATWEGEGQTLAAVADGIRFRLDLAPAKPLVIHGEQGVSQKAAGAGKASYYVSFPRLAVSGEINGRRVEGTAWMDHEWFTHQLESAQAGWDWFSAQLDDGADVMLFQLRRRDGSIDPYSSGTYIDRQGRARHLRSGEFTLQPREYWSSPRTKARYPIAWRVAIPSLGVAVDCKAALAGQELVSEHNGPTYWEGAVTYSGSATGVGYLEMTGYDKPVTM
jgi:predicted secreted hydrolase